MNYESPIREHALYSALATLDFATLRARKRAEEALSGQTSVEYILILALIGIALIAAMIALAGQMNEKLADITEVFQSAGHSGPSA